MDHSYVFPAAAVKVFGHAGSGRKLKNNSSPFYLIPSVESPSRLSSQHELNNPRILNLRYPCPA